MEIKNDFLIKAQLRVSELALNVTESLESGNEAEKELVEATELIKAIEVLSCPLSKVSDPEQEAIAGYLMRKYNLTNVVKDNMVYLTTGGDYDDSDLQEKYQKLLLDLVKLTADFNSYKSAVASTFTEDILANTNARHGHDNKDILDQITSVTLSDIEASKSHKDNTSIHVTSEEKTDLLSKPTRQEFNELAAEKANETHLHEIADVNGLVNALAQIPVKGETGNTPIITIGTVSEGSPAVTADVTDKDNPILNFVLPKGEDGKSFTVDVVGNDNERLDIKYEDKDDQFHFLSRSTGILYTRVPAYPATGLTGWVGVQMAGTNGWTPILAIEFIDNYKSVLKVVDWVGGSGSKPYNIEQALYVGPLGYTLFASSAINVRGAQGIDGIAGNDGEVGKVGFPDASGTYVDKDLYDDSAKDFLFLDDNSGLMYKKLSSTSGDWSEGYMWRGPKGLTGDAATGGKAPDSDLLDGMDSSSFEQIVNKGAAGGYAPLDESLEVPNVHVKEEVYQNAGLSRSTVTYTDNGDGTINLLPVLVSIYDNASHYGKILKLNVAGVENVSFPQELVMYYVKIRKTAIGAEYFVDTNKADIKESNILPVISLLRAETRLYVTEWIGISEGLPNKLHNKDVRINRHEIENGLEASIGGSDNLFINGGTVWKGVITTDMNQFDSSADPNTVLFDIHYYNTDRSWLYTAHSATIPIGKYSDVATGTLQSGGVDKYMVAWVYRYVGTDRNYATVLVDEFQFDSLALAREHLDRPSVPQYISSQHVYLGRLITSGDGTYKQIDNVAQVSYNVSSTLDHDSMALQGAGKIHISADELSKIYDAYSHSQSAHAPADAQKNVKTDWDATSGDAELLNKPDIPDTADDLTMGVTYGKALAKEAISIDDSISIAIGKLEKGVELASMPADAHNHDDLYNTKAEITTLLEGKASVNGNILEDFSAKDLYEGNIALSSKYRLKDITKSYSLTPSAVSRYFVFTNQKNISSGEFTMWCSGISDGGGVRCSVVGGSSPKITILSNSSIDLIYIEEIRLRIVGAASDKVMVKLTADATSFSLLDSATIFDVTSSITEVTNQSEIDTYNYVFKPIEEIAKIPVTESSLSTTLEDYYNKTEIDNLIPDTYTKVEIDNKVDSKITAPTLGTDGQVLTLETGLPKWKDTAPSVLLDEWVDEATALTKEDGTIFYSAPGIEYTKIEINALIDDRAEKATTYTKVEVDALISNLQAQIDALQTPEV